LNAEPFFHRFDPFRLSAARLGMNKFGLTSIDKQGIIPVWKGAFHETIPKITINGNASWGIKPRMIDASCEGSTPNG
jgi:hypothetical protein